MPFHIYIQFSQTIKHHQIYPITHYQFTRELDQFLNLLLFATSSIFKKSTHILFFSNSIINFHFLKFVIKIKKL